MSSRLVNDYREVVRAECRAPSQMHRDGKFLGYHDSTVIRIGGWGFRFEDKTRVLIGIITNAGCQAKSIQVKVLAGAETCATRKSTSPCRLAIPAFDRIAGLYNRHLNTKRRIRLR